MDSSNNNNSRSSGSDSIVRAIPVIVGIIMLLFCFRRSERRQREIRQVGNPPENETPEERIAMIESKLIIRKVTATKDTKDTDADDSSHATTTSNPESATGEEFERTPPKTWMDQFGKSDRVYSSFVAAVLTRNSSLHRQFQFSEPLPRANSAPNLSNPPEQQQDMGSDATANAMEKGSVGDTETEGEDNTITVEQPPLLSTRRQSNSVARTIASSIRNAAHRYEQPTTCDICLMDYEVGDEVAWSNNAACVHAFHKECIRDWLLRSPHCPLCRANYLECSGDGCRSCHSHEQLSRSTSNNTSPSVHSASDQLASDAEGSL